MKIFFSGENPANSLASILNESVDVFANTTLYGSVCDVDGNTYKTIIGLNYEI